MELLVAVPELSLTAEEVLLLVLQGGGVESSPARLEPVQALEPHLRHGDNLRH